MMINAALLGITGYTGMELARLLAFHPHIRLKAAASRSHAGTLLADFYPFLRGLPGGDVVIAQNDPDYRWADDCPIIFMAVPHGAALEAAADLAAQGRKIIDFSANFRLRDQASFEAWYKLPHTRPEALKTAVYGLPELHGQAIASASLAANPGCYPSATILGLYPALKAGIIDPASIIVDAKSGVSGAGRKAEVSSLFCEVEGSFKPYGLGKHRHTPEIEQELSLIAGQPLTISFNPHLVPMQRGILATIYTRLKSPLSLEEVHQLYTSTWAAEPHHQWIRVLPQGALPETRHVRGTMFCDIGLTVDPRTGLLIITSAIDNLCRGASGQAVASANLMCGLPLDAGLMAAPMVL